MNQYSKAKRHKKKHEMITQKKISQNHCQRNTSTFYTQHNRSIWICQCLNSCACVVLYVKLKSMCCIKHITLHTYTMPQKKTNETTVFAYDSQRLVLIDSSCWKQVYEFVKFNNKKNIFVAIITACWFRFHRNHKSYSIYWLVIILSKFFESLITS